MDYPGGFITKTVPTLNPALGNAAPGVWRLNDVLKNIKAGTWPGYDPYFDYTTLLLHGNGTNGGQNNTFLDSSTNNFTITRNGNTTQGTFSPFSQTGWSNYFDGSGDTLVLPSSSNLAVGTGDFCVEAWVYWTTTGVLDAIYSNLLNSGGGDTQLNIQLTTGNKVQVTGWSTIFLTGATSVVSNTWNHIAVCRSGTTLSVFLNGSRDATATSSNNWSSTNAFYIGDYPVGGATFSGYISNLRVVKGSTPYDATSSTLTVPTAPLTAITNTQLLTCQSNRFIDNSSNAFAITVNGNTSVQAFSPFAPTAAYSASTVGGSGYFDGTGDYLTVANNAALQFGTGTFTVEAWVYLTASSTYQAIIGPHNGDGAWVLRVDNSSGLKVAVYTGSTLLTGSTTVLTNSWVHIAMVREGTGSNQFKVYVNGTVDITNTVSNDYTQSNTYYIGAQQNNLGSTYLSGYVSSIRVVKGTAVYTGNFTPPTAPLTNITNTSLLLNFTNAAIIDNTAKNVLETVGNAQISTAQSKFGGGSISFASSGDGLNSRDSDLFDMSSGDFTVEMWARANNLSGEQFLMGQNNSSTYYAPFRIQFDGTQLRAFMSTSGSSWGLRLEAGSALSNNTWYHVALVRYGTSFKLYVNGSQYDSGTLSGALYNSSDIMRIGWAAISLGNFTFNGYLDDIRITKGIARYTSNFTPQTSQWQDQ